MPRRLALALVPALAVVALAAFDLWREEGLGPTEALLDLGEKALIVASMVAVALAMLRLDRLDAREATLRGRLDRALAEGAAWRAARAGENAALGQAIGDGFRRWGLTAAEADVAGLLLKGASMKEFARPRHLGGDDPPAGAGDPPQGGARGAPSSRPTSSTVSSRRPRSAARACAP